MHDSMTLQISRVYFTLLEFCYKAQKFYYTALDYLHSEDTEI